MSNQAQLNRDGIYGNLYIKGRQVIDSEGNGNFKSVKSQTADFKSLTVRRKTSVKTRSNAGKLEKVETYCKYGRAFAPGAGVQVVPVVSKFDGTDLKLEPGEVVMGFVCQGNNVGPLGNDNHIRIRVTTDKENADGAEDIIQGDKLFVSGGSGSDLMYEDWNCGFWGFPDDNLTALQGVDNWIVAVLGDNDDDPEWLTGSIDIKLVIVKIPLVE